MSNVRPEGRVLGSLYLLDIGYNFMTGNIGSWIDAFLNTTQLLVLNFKDNDLSGTVPDMIGSLSSLRVLLLSQNRLTGLIPEELCRLKQISMMDLSINSFFGSIPSCFQDIGFGKIEPRYFDISHEKVSNEWDCTTYFRYETLKKGYKLHSTAEQSVTHVEVDFLTKHRSSTYKGSILNFISGLDLPCNNLSGRILNAIGNLSWIHALNLSYNMFAGPIPKSFSNLTQIKSLDLSHNALSGEIPSSLINLYFLEVFSVAYNNLSGKISDTKAQLGTFDRSCYEGIRFLCGQPLNQNYSTESPHPLMKSVDQRRNGMALML
ncbi:hypothetical protein F3Y22_tig00012370pilonHSYRG00032 [Hibiscus syriacus]|uniref:Uncharacterized protein n=2 Tax=Hibiscus syriacus TaxID=106335 RepID=A0A6A3C2Q1_HIBSY|nr:hypothetical protein F3Y22_tig00012370pilonHSYRG00032 [Hibiscus syriacus]